MIKRKVFNPVTRREIEVGGSAFNALIKKGGYEYDNVANELRATTAPATMENDVTNKRVLNPVTNRYITIGTPAFYELVSQKGYRYDAAANLLIISEESPNTSGGNTIRDHEESVTTTNGYTEAAEESSENPVLWGIQSTRCSTVFKRIVHIADIHIPLGLYLPSGRRDEFVTVFELFYREIERQGPGTLVVIAGDFYQSRAMESDTIVLGQEFLSRVASLAPTVIILGNHDCTENNPGKTDLISPTVHGINNLWFLSQTGVYRFGNVICAVSSLLDGKFIHHRDIVNPAAEPIYAVYHGTVGGSLTDGGHILGERSSRFRSVTDFYGYQGVLLGDIHRYQQLKPHPIYYCGSMIQQNFGESVDHHGYLLWSLDTTSPQPPAFHELENPYAYININVTDGVIDNESELERYRNKRLRVKLRLKNTSLFRQEEVRASLNERFQIEEFRHQFVECDRSTSDGSTGTANKDITLSLASYEKEFIAQMAQPEYHEAVAALHAKMVSEIAVETENGHYWNLESLEFRNLFIYGDGVDGKELINKVDFVTGVNNLCSKNMTGKSSLVNIALLALFGPIGVNNVGSLIHTQQRYGYVKAVIISGGRRYSISRQFTMTRKAGATADSISSSLQLCEIEEGGVMRVMAVKTSEATKILAGLVGHYERFIMHNVISTKIPGSILNTTPARRLDHFIELCGINRYERYREAVEKRNKSLRQKQESLRGAYQRDAEERDLLEIDKVQTEIAALIMEKDALTATYRDELEQQRIFLQERETLHRSVEQLRASLVNIAQPEVSAAAVEERLDDLEKRERELDPDGSQTVAAQETTLSVLTRELRVLEQHLSQLNPDNLDPFSLIEAIRAHETALTKLEKMVPSNPEELRSKEAVLRHRHEGLIRSLQDAQTHIESLQKTSTTGPKDPLTATWQGGREALQDEITHHKGILKNFNRQEAATRIEHLEKLQKELASYPEDIVANESVKQPLFANIERLGQLRGLLQLQTEQLASMPTGNPETTEIAQIGEIEEPILTIPGKRPIDLTLRTEITEMIRALSNEVQSLERQIDPVDREGLIIWLKSLITELDAEETLVFTLVQVQEIITALQLGEEGVYQTLRERRDELHDREGDLAHLERDIAENAEIELLEEVRKDVIRRNDLRQSWRQYQEYQAQTQQLAQTQQEITVLEQVIAYQRHSEKVAELARIVADDCIMIKSVQWLQWGEDEMGRIVMEEAERHLHHMQRESNEIAQQLAEMTELLGNYRQLQETRRQLAECQNTLQQIEGHKTTTARIAQLQAQKGLIELWTIRGQLRDWRKAWQTLAEQSEVSNNLAQQTAKLETLDTQSNTLKAAMQQQERRLTEIERRLAAHAVTREHYERHSAAAEGRRKEIIALDEQIKLYEEYIRLFTRKNIPRLILTKCLSDFRRDVNHLFATYTGYEFNYNDEDTCLEFQAVQRGTGCVVGVERLSGFETVLLNIAINYAVLNLGTGHRSGFFVADESLDCIDDSNFGRHLPTIIESIRQVYQSMVLISHRNVPEELVDKQLVITSHQGYSTISC